ncbi:MAG: DUF2007 domain-containing protein [Flavobacteriales bacterium]
MNDPRWVKVYTVNNPMDAHMVQAVLEENEIGVLLLDKNDSSYGFGHVEILVLEDKVPEAISLIQSNFEKKN